MSPRPSMPHGDSRAAAPADRTAEVDHMDTDLLTGLEALEGAIALAGALGLDEADLAPAREVVERAGHRRRLAPQATVVALLGATGSGKSSLFNALAGAELARTAVTRPTTTRPLALLGPEPLPAGTAALLDWLGVGQRVQAPAQSLQRPGEPGPGRLGAGTILLDLPDIDSDEHSHRVIAQNLAGKVDVLVWVLDPEKYADGVVHHDFLAPMAAHAEVTIVVLNQVDRLDDQARAAVMKDLARLLDAEGMAGARLMGVSARTGAGLGELAQAITAVAETRMATVRRLSADIRTVARSLRAGLGGPVAEPSAGGALDEVAELQVAAARAAGVEVVSQAVVGAYRHRARTAVGWLPVRWIEHLRRDPLRVLHLGAGASQQRTQAQDQAPGSAPPASRSSLPEAGPAATGALRIAAHAYAARACAGLPTHWAAEAVARSDQRAQDLAPPLDAAVVGTDLEQSRPRWWSVANLLQWLVGLTALAGGLWLVALHLMDSYLLITADPPRWGHVPWPVILLVVGIALGILLAVICGGIARVAAARRGRRVAARLRQQTDRVIDAQVVAPLGEELASWAQLNRLLNRLCSSHH